jgi:ribosomal protein L7/L12
MNAVLPIKLIALGVVAIAAVFANARRQKKLASFRARGVYPEEGKETDDDVRRLAQGGEKILAIQRYRALHKVGLEEAKEAVELLEKTKPNRLSEPRQ